MKNLLFTGLLTAFALAAFAQSEKAKSKADKTFSLGLGLEAGLAMGDTKNAYNFVPGLTLRAAYKVGPGAATFTTGALAFLPKELEGEDLKASLQIPFKAGYKLIFNNHFFVMGELGFSNFRQYFEGVNGEVESASSTGFTYAPAAGFQFGGLELGFRYESTSVTGGSLSAALVRLGFTF